MFVNESYVSFESPRVSSPNVNEDSLVLREGGIFYNQWDLEFDSIRLEIERQRLCESEGVGGRKGDQSKDPL